MTITAEDFSVFSSQPNFFKILALKCSPNSALAPCPQPVTKLGAWAQDTHFHCIDITYNIPGQPVKTTEDSVACALHQTVRNSEVQIGMKAERKCIPPSARIAANTLKSERKAF